MLAPKSLGLLVATCASIYCARAYDAQLPLTGGFAGRLDVVSLSAQEQEALLQELYANMDVVDLMHMTGHGAGLDDERLVHMFGEDEARWMTEGDKLRLKKAGYYFADITETPNLGQLNAQRPSQLYSAPLLSTMTDSGRKDIRRMFTGLGDKHLRADIEKLTSFWNRNAYSNWGKLSSEWVLEHVKGIVSGASKLNTDVRQFAHKFPQSSVIAHLEGADDETANKTLVIIGAHQDSLNYAMPYHRAPGADDDGSGTVTIMQILRSLIEHEFVPPKGVALEFHWYAAEERGLLGSRDIAASYEKAGASVKGMLQMDMTAWVANGTTPKIAFFDELTDPELTKFAAGLVETYIPLPWNLTGCGFGCGSDHSSWTRAGYPGIFATEGFFNDFQKRVHTPYDDLSEVDKEYSFEHMLEFVKLGIAFVAELSVA
ncbi:Zn-dependent exopeptidase [Auriculariales sp. MPI-PUGE-AT-0066]|nr:Zn-dependent exopeptidase [Auriculariales sp. MPI-PUGE-AT-0066]